MSAVRPRLGAFLNGLPDVENLFPILSALHKRGRVGVTLFATAGLWFREPRVRALLGEAGIRFRLLPNRLMKARFCYRRLLRGVDRMLVLADPATDGTSYRERSRYCAEAGVPTAWVQHGLVQRHVHYAPRDGAPVEFHSDLVFYWEDPARHEAPLAPGAAGRVRVSGFTKRPVLPRWDVPRGFAGRLAGFRERVLVCHSYRNGEFDREEIDRTYGMLRAYCLANPDVAVILRPHRGKVRASYRGHNRRLAAECSNVFLSLWYKGPMKGMNMGDVLPLADRVVSTASTAVLDALYQGKPAAVLPPNIPLLSGLPEISGLDDLAEFVEAGMTPRMRELLSHYGSVEDNIGFVCRELEGKMLGSEGAAP